MAANSEAKGAGVAEAQGTPFVIWHLTTTAYDNVHVDPLMDNHASYLSITASVVHLANFDHPCPRHPDAFEQM